MSECFVGEVRLVGFNFAPYQWNFCDGTTLSIASNETLYNLIGTTYGGNGQTTFNLPDLRGRIPIHQGTLQGGSNYAMGAIGGAESVTLSGNQIPQHNHPMLCNSAVQGGTASPNNAVLTGGKEVYRSSTPGTAMNPGILTSAGQSQSHENRQPFLAMYWVIALYGVYPTQS
jgi:microcystin-dependent protein